MPVAGADGVAVRARGHWPVAWFLSEAGLRYSCTFLYDQLRDGQNRKAHYSGRYRGLYQNQCAYLDGHNQGVGRHPRQNATGVWVKNTGW